VPTLVDGSNLGGRIGGRHGARDHRLVLGAVLAWARRRRARVTVVFDGPPVDHVAVVYGTVAVRFAGSRSADDVILELAGRAPRSTRVVTDDAALASRCRTLGCAIVPIPELLIAVPEADAERPQGPVDVADWEAWFRGERD
jgi:hypothetical protein